MGDFLIFLNMQVSRSYKYSRLLDYSKGILSEIVTQKNDLQFTDYHMFKRTFLKLNEKMVVKNSKMIDYWQKKNQVTRDVH